MGMNITPGNRLLQQFNTIKAMFENNIIIDTIDPICENYVFTYSNTVPTTPTRSTISAKYFNSAEQYLTMFRSRSYHFLFYDASIARLNYEFDDNSKLLSYNLHWIPCPFSTEYLSGFIEEGQLDKMELFNYLDSVDLEEKFSYTNFSLRTPIRIDFDANYEGKKGDFHPTSHIHFQDTDTRAKINNIYCLYRFFAFIVENCYPSYYYDFHISNTQISSKMINSSTNWLKCKKVINEDLGMNINTNLNY